MRQLMNTSLSLVVFFTLLLNIQPSSATETLPPVPFQLSPAFEDSSAVTAHWLCRPQTKLSVAAVRSLRIYGSKDGQCKVTYTKGREEALVGTAKEKGQCDRYVEGIKKNLEAGNWQCRQAGRAQHLISAPLKADMKSFATSQQRL